MSNEPGDGHVGISMTPAQEELWSKIQAKIRDNTSEAMSGVRTSGGGHVRVEDTRIADLEAVIREAIPLLERAGRAVLAAKMRRLVKMP